MAHLIHPFLAPATSDLFMAQPITIETMLRAKIFTPPEVTVGLYTIQYVDEAPISLPADFKSLPGLVRSVAHIKSFQQPRKLALIIDLLEPLYQHSEADYLIYTNVDIALQPHFYQFVAHIIQQGYDAFVINRRTITETYTTIPAIPFMYAQIGEAHKGYDCFVFKRQLYPRFVLGHICIGTAWIGRALLANMVTHAEKFREFRHEHLTFHIGDPCSWRDPAYNDYFSHNQEEYHSIFARLESQHGPFEPALHSYLLDTGDSRYLPDFEHCDIHKGKIY